ncbi:hypothetical protein C2845_PM07G22170 [Panicum miliaceum]|uniref:Uncharacterized protein n=1 Tax=Panicum miliaceum TaxID=4540 RepID=A0A3L6SLV5_PANMI|nr:hypothetical protein C2845_PM07G22170 [Panicum miliaceum]
MPTTVQDRGSDVSKARLAQYARMLDARGILVNSFDWLESRALEALRCGLCTPGRSTPPVHCVGPLVLPGNAGGISERHAFLEWLDTQPDRSVVFLSFGSLGRFSTAQLREMARGLENSGQRFLWVVRNPPEHQSNSVEPDLESLLPEGFLDRTRERGFVVKNWVPQPAERGAAAPIRWSIRDALLVELGARGHRVRSANDLLAIVCGTKNEQGAHGGGDEGRGGGGGLRGGAGEGGGAGNKGEIGDGA